MKIYSLYIFLIIFVSTITGCSTDVQYPTDTTHEEIEVVFDILESFDFDTRGIQENAKRKFNEGDKIHIGATFYLDNGTEHSSAYNVMTLTNGKWVQNDFKPIIWPGSAAKGIFHAYYIDHNWYNVKLEAGDQYPAVLNLSNFDDKTDPLYAESEEVWGHKVTLQFKHICTHLTFTNLEPDIADYFWLIKHSGKELNNGFSLQVTEDNKLTSSFSQIVDPAYNVTYVQHPSSDIYDEVSGIKIGSKVSFFLEPGDYSDIEIKTINNYSYLSYKSELTSSLQANVPYVIEIDKSKGVTYVEEKEEWEDPDNNEIIDVDPFEFIKSIINNDDYSITDSNNKKIPIIERTAAGVALRRNVSFGFKTDYVNQFGDNLPDLPTSGYFDGGNHYICNIATNIFNTNSGTICHLGLHNVKCENVVLSKSGNMYNWGALCTTNKGNVENIRIDEAEIVFKIEDNEPIDVYEVGVLIGRTDGASTVSNINYSGQKISIKTFENNGKVNATVYIGGFIGQVASGVVNGISPAENCSIEIINKFSGERGTYFVGGAFGVGITDIQEISLPTVHIDCSESIGLLQYAGGIAGRLRSSTDNPSILSSCTVGGWVKGGDIQNIKEASVSAYCYTGGLVGSTYFYNISDCRSVCDVYGPLNAVINDSETYATGGAFGRIVSEYLTYGNYALGTILQGPNGGYIGNFAGIVPSIKTWNDYSDNGNAARDILGNQQNIGASMDDNTQSN